MKILMVLEKDFPPDLRVENEMKSLLEAHHTVILASFTFTGTDRIEEWNDCKIFKTRISKFIHKSSVGALKFPFYFNFWENCLTTIIEKEKPDAIHVHDLPLARVGVNMKYKFGIKLILDLHENWPAFLRISKHANTFLGKLLSSNSEWEKYEINSCNKADYVIVVIEEAKERLVKLGIPAGKILNVPNYPVLSDFDEMPGNKKNEEGITLFCRRDRRTPRFTICYKSFACYCSTLSRYTVEDSG
jgi:hypothetical protein